MSLRSQIHLIVLVVAVSLLGLVIGLHVISTRASVREEVEAANRVAVQFLARFRQSFGIDGVAAAAPAVRDLGRVRSNEIELRSTAGELLYRSPPSAYKSGREAPAWFRDLTAPRVIERSIDLPDGRLVVRSDPSRAVLDGWDDFTTILLWGGVVIPLATGLAYLALRRALGPISAVADGLRRAQAGDLSFRVPEGGGSEARALASAFNGLMVAVQDGRSARHRAQAAEQERDLSRDMALRFERELEAERRAIARDLHDELGQHATALKTLAATFERRLAVSEPSLAQLATLMMRSADALFATIRAMIHRVRPEALERGGLVDGLRALVDDWRLRQPDMRFELLLAPPDDARFGLGEEAVEAAAYRVVQEAVTNAVRHSGGSTVVVSASVDGERLTVQVADDGRGLPPEGAAASGGTGRRNMAERVQAFGGTLRIGTGDSGGTEVIVELPWPGPGATV